MKKNPKKKSSRWVLLNEINSQGFNIYGISAPSRATTLINYLGIRKDIIDCILEIDGSKKINHLIKKIFITIFTDDFHLYSFACILLFTHYLILTLFLIQIVWANIVRPLLLIFAYTMPSIL